MTATARLLLRRRPTARPTTKRPRPRIVEVTNTWRVTAEGNLRAVIVREVDDTLTRRYLADDHPALVRSLDRLAAAVA